MAAARFFKAELLSHPNMRRQRGPWRELRTNIRPTNENIGVWLGWRGELFPRAWPAAFSFDVLWAECSAIWSHNRFTRAIMTGTRRVCLAIDRAIVRGEGGPSPSRSGSPYVPLDSWVYPMLDRLRHWE